MVHESLLYNRIQMLVVKGINLFIFPIEFSTCHSNSTRVEQKVKKRNKTKKSIKILLLQYNLRNKSYKIK